MHEELMKSNTKTSTNLSSKSIQADEIDTLGSIDTESINQS